jgi:hypothetical protein
MGILDEFLSEYRSEESFGDSLSPLSPRKRMTEMNSHQHDEIMHKNKHNDARGDLQSLEQGSADHKKSCLSSNRLGKRSNNVAFVACVRENESAKIPSSSQKGNFSDSPPVFSYARASDKGDKTHCDSCPACGYWDGHGPWRMEPGSYCFYKPYFKGKAARPVPIAEAQKACPKEADLNVK